MGYHTETIEFLNDRIVALQDRVESLADTIAKNNGLITGIVNAVESDGDAYTDGEVIDWIISELTDYGYQTKYARGDN